MEKENGLNPEKNFGREDNIEGKRWEYKQKIINFGIQELEKETENFLEEVNSNLQENEELKEKLFSLAEAYFIKYLPLLGEWQRRQSREDSGYNREVHFPMMQELMGRFDDVKKLEERLKKLIEEEKKRQGPPGNEKEVQEREERYQKLLEELKEKMQSFYKGTYRTYTSQEKIDIPVEWLYFLLRNQEEVLKILRELRKKQLDRSFNYEEKVITSFLDKINFEKIPKDTSKNAI
jgi:hypothetical protein